MLGCSCRVQARACHIRKLSHSWIHVVFGVEVTLIPAPLYFVFRFMFGFFLKPFDVAFDFLFTVLTGTAPREWRPTRA